MSTISPASQQAIFDRLGIRTAKEEVAATGTSNLGQEDFLKLMTVQLQNQDPFAPMENGDFIGQMAQFSTVSGIGDLNTTLGSIEKGLSKLQISTASSLLGHSVLVPGNIARADANGNISGVADLPEAASGVRINYRNAETGELLHSQNMGVQSAGLLGFNWDGVPSALRDSRTPIQISVETTTNEGTTEIGSSVYARVLSANTSRPELEVEDYGAIAIDEIDSFR